MKKIFVTGGNGQLGQCLKDCEAAFGNGNEFRYFASQDLDITDEEQVNNLLSEHKPDYVINCAAYTAVDKAEQEPERAHLVNEKGAEFLAKACNKFAITLIHISTDFVFGDVEPVPLSEQMETSPFGVYGRSKLFGEQRIVENLRSHFIIRTSWLYSEHQNNFMKTMLRLGNEREELSVVFDQVGTPTYAMDLAKCILVIINTGSQEYGIYHYSNEGVASWYDFAHAIFKNSGSNIVLKPIMSNQYPTPAKRPSYSVMSKEKVKKVFNLEINHWTESLAQCQKNIK